MIGKIKQFHVISGHLLMISQPKVTQINGLSLKIIYLQQERLKQHHTCIQIPCLIDGNFDIAIRDFGGNMNNPDLFPNIKSFLSTTNQPFFMHYHAHPHQFKYIQNLLNIYQDQVICHDLIIKIILIGRGK